MPKWRVEVEETATYAVTVEAAKPKPEVWRWRFEDGSVSRHFEADALGLRLTYGETPGTPVRETVDADGRVTLTPEGVGE